MIDFAPLWETMQHKKISQYQLLKRGLDNKTLDTLKKNRNITLSTLEKIFLINRLNGCSCVPTVTKIIFSSPT